MGAGCFSKEKDSATGAHAATAAPQAPQPAPQATPAPVATPVAKTILTDVIKPGTMAKKVYIIFYSMYGHIYKLAQAIKEGVDSVDGVEGVLYQVAETLPEDVLAKMHAAPKPDVPVVDPHTINEADGLAFGFPTRFGMMAAQMKAFWDATGGHWQKQSLARKPAGLFTSTASQNGGQETTIMTAVTQLTHHGMIFVPPGYAAGPSMFGLDAPKGGSPWGAGTFAGPDGSRQPTKDELDAAVVQGKILAEVTLKLAA